MNSKTLSGDITQSQTTSPVASRATLMGDDGVEKHTS